MSFLRNRVCEGQAKVQIEKKVGDSACLSFTNISPVGTPDEKIKFERGEMLNEGGDPRIPPVPESGIPLVGCPASSIFQFDLP